MLIIIDIVALVASIIGIKFLLTNRENKSNVKNYSGKKFGTFINLFLFIFLTIYLIYNNYIFNWF